MKQNDPVGVRALGIVVYPPNIGGLGKILRVDQDSQTGKSRIASDSGYMLIQLYLALSNLTHLKSYPTTSFCYSEQFVKNLLHHLAPFIQAAAHSNTFFYLFLV